MITKKALIAKLQTMDLDEILFQGARRDSKSGGKWHATQVALEKIITGNFGQSTYATKRGTLKETPKWFRQMYVNISWDSGDVTPGSILQALI
jgi:hypothetical protein